MPQHRPRHRGRRTGRRDLPPHHRLAEKDHREEDRHPPNTRRAGPGKGMSRDKPFSLFEVTGIELKYMVVERGTLRASPTVDQLFRDVNGRTSSDVQRGDVDWSNELVAHVLELKTA